MELYLQTPYTFTELYIMRHRAKRFDKLVTALPIKKTMPSLNPESSLLC